MVTKTATPERRSARDRLLAAADELFYEEGFNTVGIDRVIEHAGVAKASLYDCFGSKEELIRAYLLARHEARKARITERLTRYKTPKDKILGVFDSMAEFASATNFRGCAFARASAEAKPGSIAKGVCDDSRAWMRELFTQLAREAGASNAERLGHQLVLIYDGAAVSAHVDSDRSAVAAARAMATLLLDTETASRPRRRK